MATVFKRKGSSVYLARLKLWDSELNDWTWRTRTTGARDKGDALSIALKLEEASRAASSGTMTREKALETVNFVLTLAGSAPITEAPSLAAIVEGLLASRDKKVSAGTSRKYWAHWERFKARMPVDNPVNQIGGIQEYYDETCREISAGTANDHLRSIRMWFAHAIKRGHISTNPAEMVDTAERDSVDKLPLSSGDVAAVVRKMRKAKRRDWVALVLLGWHTGARIQDCLSITAGAIDENGVWTFTPEKKKRKKALVSLPLPGWLARMLVKMEDLSGIHSADNRNGKVSAEFVQWLIKAEVDPMPIKTGKRTVHQKSFHSLRHSMATRLAAAGVPGDLARMVTDHDSEKVYRGYQHADVEAIRGALRALKKTESSARKF